MPKDSKFAKECNKMVKSRFLVFKKTYPKNNPKTSAGNTCMRVGEEKT
jgi:hypothetical protein